MRVELVGDEWQGERRWVSPARLEVRWEDRGGYIELDRKAKALRLRSPIRDERRAVEHVLLETAPIEVVWYNADSAGVSTVYDVPAVEKLLNISAHVIRAAAAYEHEGELFVPWPTTKLMARTAARLFPYRLLHEIETEEWRLNEETIHGTSVTDFEGEDHELRPEDVQALFEKYQRPRLDALRGLIGVERADDLLKRRDLLLRLGKTATIAKLTLDVLEPTQKRIASRLRAELKAAMDGINVLPPSRSVD